LAAPISTETVENNVRITEPKSQNVEKTMNTLLLKFHLPFLGKKSSPFPTFNCGVNKKNN
jgi:hypothetical protein